MAASKHRGIKILKLKDGRYVARWLDPISRKQKQQSMDPLGITNEKARTRWCIEKFEAIQTVKRALSITHGTAMPLRVSIIEAQTNYLATFASVNTREAKTPALANVAAYMAKEGVVDVLDITGPAIVGYADHTRRPSSKLKTSTVNLHLQVVAAWCRWCRDRGMLPLLTDDQIKKLLKRKEAEHNPISILQPQQLRKLLTSCLAHDENEKTKIAPFALMTILTGGRLEEVAGLHWDEVNRAEKVIRLPSHRTKTRRARDISLTESPTALRLLDALALGGTRGRVFKPGPDTSTSCRKRLIRDYDAPNLFTWRMLRATCGSLLVCGGIYGNAGVFSSAQRLGHSVAISERHYLSSLKNLPLNCKSIEEAANMQAEANAIVRSVAVVDTKGRRAAQ